MVEDEEKSIRVVDRRMFTPEGELRPDFQAEENVDPPKPAPPPAASRPAQETATPRPSPRAEQELSGDFIAIARSLASAAYAALGLLPDPAGGGRRDPRVAQQMIDWLAVLEQKTRGNLSFEESDFLSRVLYELRLAYVEVSRSPAK